jgi:hypothetical protein
MSPTRAKLPSMAAALAGVPAGIAERGPWLGRRQLFVRFAGEAETATIYTAEGLRGELARLSSRSKYHSIAIAGREPLAEPEFLVAAFREGSPLPVMLEHDGQRPEALDAVLGCLGLMQVTMDGAEKDAEVERACDSLARAAGKKVEHALAIVPAESATDAQLLRLVERVHAASPAAAVVLHPSVESAAARDRRWVIWLERATAVHDDVRMIPVGAGRPAMAGSMHGVPAP